LDIAIWCGLSSLVAGVLVYLWQERRRGALGRDLAVAQARWQDLERSNSVLEERHERMTLSHQLLSNDREGLRATLQQVQQQQTAARTELERVDGERLALNHHMIQTQAHHAATLKENEGLRSQLVDQKDWVIEQTRKFEQSVLISATRIMDERGKVFNEQNKKEMDSVVSPFKEQLENFRRRVDEIHSAETRAQGQLDERIVQLTSLNQSTSLQTERLIKALTITSKSSGDWGETILQRILEDSGLRAGKEYVLQVPIQGADGERLQPDAVIYLPENRQLVVDSKVSNKAWAAFCSEPDEGLREERFKEHLLSLRAHVKNLAGKNYARSPDLKTVDFVLMFVPVEAALLAAFTRDDSLYLEAYRQKIILVVPSTLMAVVKMAESLWSFQKRKESADEIAEVGRKLYEKLSNFAHTFVDVGKSIDDARRSFDQAQGQLSSGRGNAIGLAEQLKELGVTPNAGKEMPANLLLADDSVGGVKR
jgi:DNA recombination protein RmuC